MGKKGFKGWTGMVGTVEFWGGLVVLANLCLCSSSSKQQGRCWFLFAFAWWWAEEKQQSDSGTVINHVSEAGVGKGKGSI